MSSPVLQGLITVAEILAIGFGLYLLWESGLPGIVRFLKYILSMEGQSEEETPIRNITEG